MIISHQYKFIFIKTFKTAGTSIEAYLSPLCDANDVFTPIFPPIKEHQPRNFQQRILANDKSEVEFFNHIPAREVRRIVGPRIWDGYYKFCVERNPWDRTLSFYRMLQRRGGQFSFESYLKSNALCQNFCRYTDQQKQVIVDRVLRFEDLNQELDQVFGQLGIPFSGELTVRAKSHPSCDQRPYQSFYSPDQRDLIGSIYSDEINLLGYEFE